MPLHQLITKRYKIALLGVFTLTWAMCAHADYGLAMGGTAKYGDGKQGFAYANPNAPKGGSLVMGSLGDFNTLNPYLLKGDKLPGLAELGDNFVFDTLMVESWDEPFAMYGLLASDIALAADKLSVTFTLNPKARFQNGDAVLAKDVVYTFNTITKDEAATPLYRFYYADVKRAVALDAQRVRFEFAKPNAELHLILGQIQIFSHKSFPLGFAKSANVLPIGSGPYTLARHEFGQLVQYQRRPDYWAQNLPIRKGFWNFDQIRFKVYRDPTAFTEALKAGKIDLTYENSAKNWSRTYANPSLAKRGLQM